MNDIEDILKKYSFFKEQQFKVTSIQDYGRKSKFKVEMNDKYYTVILEEERIKPYINKFNILGDNFKKIIGFEYLSPDEKVLVLDYFGNNRGLNLYKIEEQNKNFEDANYSLQLKKLIDEIHANKLKYVDFNESNYSSWQEYYSQEISSKIESIAKQKLITIETKEQLLDRLEQSAKVYENFESTFIHADITPLNVCLDPLKKEIYLIDYDDFKIGDPLIDISRIINCKNMSKVFANLVDNYYSAYEENINHLFYTLRVHVNWYNQIRERKQEDIYDIDKAKQDIFDVIDKILSK